MNEEKIYAKSLKLGGDEVVCPECCSILTIPEEIIDDPYVQCAKCDTAVANPFCKILICGYCGNGFPIPKNLANESMIICGECGELIHNTYSDKYTSAVCPNCMVESYMLNEHTHARYLNCPNCGERFKNPLR